MSSAQAVDDKYMATGLTTTSLQAQTTYSTAVTTQSYMNQQSYAPSGTPTQQMGSVATLDQTYSPPYLNQQIYPSGSVSSIPSVSEHASGTQPTYSASATQLTYPTSAGQSTYPTSATQQAYPASATQPTYPISMQPSNSDSYQSNFTSAYAADTQLSYQTGTTPSTHNLQSYSSDAQQSYYPGGTSMTGTGAYQGYSTGTAGANTSHLYQTGGSASITDQNAGAVGYGNYSNYYPQGYTASGTQPPTQQQVTPVAAPKTKESNIDLLSGLDFTINQAPLIPQQNVAPKTEASEVIPTTTSESKTNAAKATPPKEEKPTSEIKRLSVKILPSKQLNNSDVKNLFKQEIEKYEKYVETLTNKTLSGPTNLDIKWKEIQDKQDAEGQKRIISVARCYPMKNRFPDILPYDFSRVELYGTKDDYINASYIYVSMKSLEKKLLVCNI